MAQLLKDRRSDEEKDQLNLKNYFFFLYAPGNSEKDDTLFDNLQIAYSRRIQRYQIFLDIHFDGYLSKTKNKKEICGVPMRDSTDFTNTRGDLFIGRSNCRGKGAHIRNAFIDVIKSKEYQKGYSCVIDEIEEKNRKLLVEWNLKLEEVREKLLRFTGRMRKEERKETENLIEMSSECQDRIFAQIEQLINTGMTLESMAAPVTWLLLTALLRGKIDDLEDYYINMGKKTENKSEKNKSNTTDSQEREKKSVPGTPRYTNPDEIRPYTMEEIGNLRNTYVKRERMLEMLYRKMHTGPENDKKYVFISAMGGEGKTELARAYAYTYRNEYDEIFWFTCVNEEMPGIEKLLQNSIYSKTVTPEILNQLDERCLLILDNCNSISSNALRQMYQRTGQAHLLITTRLAGITQVSARHILFLKQEKQDQADFACQVFAANYLAEPRNCYATFEEDIFDEENTGVADRSDERETDFHVDWRKAFSEKECADIKKICHFTGNHPMTAAIMAVMLREKRDNESVGSLYEKCRMGLESVFPKYELIPFGQGEEDYEKEPLEILKALFASFPRRPFTLYERQFLHIMEFAHGMQMGITYICRVLGDHAQEKPFLMACRALCSFNWLQSNGKWVSVHPLIRKIIKLDRKRIEIDDENQFYRNAFENYLTFIYENDESNEEFLFGFGLWVESNVIRECSPLNLAANLLMKKRFSRGISDIFEKTEPEVEAAILAVSETGKEILFLYYDLICRKTVVFYRIQKNEKNAGTQYEEAVSLKIVTVVCRKESMELEFPDELLGCPITKIPSGFCRKNPKVVRLRLPEKLEIVDSMAFMGCENLEGELVLPKSLRIIGDGAFERCEKLKGDLVLHENMEAVGKRAFIDCGLDGNLVIMNGIKEIQEEAFMGSGFTGCLKIPESVAAIGRSAFKACRSLAEIRFTEGLRIIDKYAFEGCENLNQELELPETLERLGSYAFADCGMLRGTEKLPENLKYPGQSVFSKDGVAFQTGRKQSFTVRIPDRAFVNSELREIQFPLNLQEIGISAFENCQKLVKVELPQTLSVIERNAFAHCNMLTKLCMQNGLRKIGMGAFQKTGLHELIFPESLEIIEEYAFFYCMTLRRIVLSEGLKRIGAYAFYNNRDLFGILELPESLQETGIYAFAGSHFTDIIIKNPHMEIEPLFEEKNDWIPTIWGYEGSTAHIYAEEMGYPFREIDEQTGIETVESAKTPDEKKREKQLFENQVMQSLAIDDF